MFMPHIARIHALFIGILFSMMLSACGESKVPVEEEIQQFIANGVAAAEAGDAQTLKTMIGRDYEDERGYKRFVIGKLLQTYLSQRKNIHVLYTVKSIEIVALDYVKVVMTVAIANQDVSDESLWDGINADFQRLELDIEKEGDWLVKKATWSPAMLSTH
jgi:hypothetical protein